MLISVLFCYFFFPGFGTYSSLWACRICGHKKGVQEKQIRFTKITLKKEDALIHSDLSRILEAKGFNNEHKHEWLLIRGEGNGIRCAIGPGYWLYYLTSEKTILKFVEQLSKFREKDEIKGDMELVFTQKAAKKLPVFLLNFNFPENGFDTKENFQLWWKKFLPAFEKTVLTTKG
ncbi:hypothetical protein ACFL35_11970 [Candidatus Riflebacteria bacterium]